MDNQYNKKKTINKLSLFIAVNINVSEENPYKNKQHNRDFIYINI